MSGTTGTPTPARSDAVRPLPARPSLEFERKRAKKLLRELRRDDPGAKLADAQFRVAREYGFLSWPRLVEYFETLERHERSVYHEQSHLTEHLEIFARNILSHHKKRVAHTVHLLQMFVPRFFGRTADEILSSQVTIDDARLVVARQYHSPSWEVLIERSERARPWMTSGWETVDRPLSGAVRALKAGDFSLLTTILDEHPYLMEPPTREDPSRWGSIVGASLGWEWSSQSAEARRATDWLVERGASLRDALGKMLIEAHFGRLHLPAEEGAIQPTVAEYVRFLLDRGADPTWLPPNGLTVLEHAIVRYEDPDAIDLLAERVVPRKALWIAAGLGDVRGVARYFDRDGKLTDAGRRNRPDLLALRAKFMGAPTDAPDNDILFEVFYIALLNKRWTVLDFLLDRGFPIDHDAWGAPMLAFFLMNQYVDQVEYLVSRGANLDIRIGRPDETPREAARWLYAHRPDDPKALRILELCGGGDPAEVIAAYKAKQPPPTKPVLHKTLLEALNLAREDAVRLGQSTVKPHNVFVASLRGEWGLPLGMLQSSGVDPVKLREQLGQRLSPVSAGVVADLPLSPAVAAAIEVATAEQAEKRHPHVTSLHILMVLAREEEGVIAALIAAAGGSIERFNKQLERAL